MQTYGGHSDDDEVPQVSQQVSGTARLRPEDVRAEVLDLWQNDYDGIVAFVMVNGATKEAAEDAAQDAFIDAWRSTNTPGAWENIYNPSGWIRTIAVRRYWRAYKKTSREVPTELTEPLTRDRASDLSELTVLFQLVRTILSRLDADTRLVMALHIEEFTSAEIARLLGRDSQKIRDLTKKGRRA